MKKLFVLLGVIVGVVLIAGGVLIWLLQDANRFKPELESLVQNATGMDFKIDGDLSWQLWPPVTLSAADISSADAETSYQLGSLGVKADLGSLLTGGGELKVQNVVLTDLVMTDKELGDVTRVHRLQLTDFAIGKASPLSVRATLESPDSPPADLNLQALLTYDQEADSATLENMEFDYDGIQGTCDASVAHISREPVRKDKRTKDDVLPLSTFRSMDWVADCNIPEYALDDLSIRNIIVQSQNTSARSKNVITVPDLFGGSLQLNADINTRSRSPAWVVTTDAKDLDSQQVAAVLSPKLTWAAPLLVGGTFNLKGNTPEALVKSMAGTAQIDAGQGQIDISMLKEAVMGIAQLTGKSEEIGDWPEQLSYTKFGGNWDIKGTEQTLAFVLDNIKLDGKGELNALTDTLDMALSVTINEHPTMDVLKVNEALYGVPIPIRCKGTMTEPECGLDSSAAQSVVKNIAAGQARREVDEKLDDVLEDKVPEEYRESAKKLIDGLFKRKKD